MPGFVTTRDTASRAQGGLAGGNIARLAPATTLVTFGTSTAWLELAEVDVAYRAGMAATDRVVQRSLTRFLR